MLSIFVFKLNISFTRSSHYITIFVSKHSSLLRIDLSDELEFGLERIVSQSLGRFHVDLCSEDLSAERTVVHSAGQTGLDPALFALYDRFLRWAREDVRLAGRALHFLQSRLPLLLGRSHLPALVIKSDRLKEKALNLQIIKMYSLYNIQIFNI